MRRFLILILILGSFAIPVSAQNFSPPTIPESGEMYMPEDTQSFSEGLWYIIKTALGELQPEIASSARICLSVIALALLLSVIKTLPFSGKLCLQLASSVGVGVVLLQPTGNLISLGLETVNSISEYGKLLIPVLTASLAAQGGIQTSTALYAVTTVFCSVLTGLVSKILVPLIYIFLCLSVAGCALGHQMLQDLRKAVKQFATFCLKTILYVFTGFLSITGVVSGTTDASALKAAKLTISGMVPVVGGILSDASEAVLVGTAVMKNAAGIYGLLAIISVWIGPFLQIGVQYLLIKLTGALCNVFATKQMSALVQDFSGAMGLVLAMTATSMVVLLISVVCYMRGVA